MVKITPQNCGKWSTENGKSRRRRERNREISIANEISSPNLFFFIFDMGKGG